MATRGATVLKWDHWHIEVSSVCALQCPRCPRAEVPDSLLNRQLSLNFFQTQLGESVIKQIRKITFCGNDGDPIYCRDFSAICAWIKSVNPSIELVIITNGSHRRPEWWQELAGILTDQDSVHFSIDGWDNASNNIYRQGSDFDSICNAIAVLQKHSTCYLVWAAIAFRFNESQLGSMQDLARNLGMHSFQLTKSTKFGSKYPKAYGAADSLEPNDRSLVATGHRFERTVIALTDRKPPGLELKMLFLQRSLQIAPYSGICLIGNKGVFLNSQGEFYPCCWVANRYSHNQSWHNRFNLYQQTFDQILQDSFWQTEFLQFDSLECRTKCTPERLQDPAHTSEW